MENFQQFYQGKKVLITGADGFIGSHLTEKLLDYRAKIIVFVKDNTLIRGSNDQKLNNIAHLKGKIKILSGNIFSYDFINLVKKESPNIIFHLAADAYINKSFNQPREVIQTNVDGTLNVLHSGLDEKMTPLKSLERIVITSSSEIYGTYDTKIKEDFELKPSSPYGASKAAADRLAYAYFNTYNLPIAIIRPFNTYGERHTYDVVPKFISLALSGKDITIYGNGEQSRDLMYVDDTVNGFLIMGCHEKAIGEAVNFGTGKDVKVIDLANKIIEILKSDSKISHLPPRLSEVKRLCCNNSKAKQLFGWESKISIDDGLKRNIDWCKINL